MESLWQDVRLGVRGLANSRGFTVVALLTLALGIGANTALFTVLNAVLLRALPVENPQQLVMLSNPEAHGIGVGDGSGARYLYAYTEFQDLRDRNQVFSGLCAADSHVRRTEVAVADAPRAGESEQADVSLVSGDYFRVLGIRPFRGRIFTADADKVQHANPVAVISHGYWKSRFALDPAIIGRKIRIRQNMFDIIGVAQPGYSGETVGFSTDIWVPLTMQTEVFPAWTDFLAKPSNPLEKILWLQVIARLKPGMTRQHAQSGINLTQRQIREPEAAGMSADRRREYLDSRITLVDGSRGANTLSDSVGDPLKILMAMVGLILLIACANVATLVLARGAARQREIAVRMALGASRRRLLQQLLTESVLLAVMGGALGIVLAQWGDRLLLRLVSGSNPVMLDLRPDARILAFTMGLSLLTGVLFGLIPGLRATRPRLNDALQGAAKGALRGGGYEGKLPAGRLLVVGQIALSLSVLMVAGLFLHSLQNLAHLDPGFDHDHLLQFDLGFLETSGYKGAAVHQVHTQLLARLRNIPRVQGAALAFMGIFAGNDTGHQISLDASTPKTDAQFRVRNDLVPAGYFSAIGQRIVMGREFNAADERGKQDVGVINQTMAHKFFGNSNPLGKRVWYDHDHPQQFVVVGVAADSKHNSLREPASPEFWLPFFNAAGDEPSFCSFQVRFSGDKGAVAIAIRAAVKEVAPAVPPLDIRSMNELLGESMITERAISQLAAFFGLLALGLASIGLYGVMAHNVTRRINEIGIRMALGAQPGDILRIVLRETVLLVAVGMVFGLPSILAAKRWISSQLFGLTALDPMAIGAAALLLAAVTVVAGYVPARWASHVDPMTALHYDG
ncbi:MAG TPA: ABC transporter permease [Bryobacteraceae bacterium]|nr:ABC transporter permease [Bryobacteraceae bacterium]